MDLFTFFLRYVYVCVCMCVYGFRYFGDFDAKDLLFYNKVWPVDTVTICKRGCLNYLLECSV